MGRMRTPEDHAHAVAAVIPAREVVTVSLLDALGLPLAHPVAAVADSPRFDNSQMDGFALSAAHLAALPGRFPVGAEVAAGTDPDELHPEGLGAEVVPIMTGAKLPRRTAAVVPVEVCDPPLFVALGETIGVLDTVEPGQFLRPRGGDIRAGDPLLAAGTIVTPVAVGVLAGQDIATVEVHAPHRVLLCTGGAEVGSAGAAGIPDSNGPMLQALCAAAGIEVAAHVRTDDDPEALREALAGGVEKHAPTAIITSGGISAGAHEVVRQVLGPGGWFGHVNQQPGGPQGLAEFHGVPVICLPGNPVSTLVSFRLFVAPALGIAPDPVAATLTTDCPGLPVKEQFLRGTLDAGRATPVGGAGSHLLAQALPATCLIRIPAGGLPAGSTVTVHPLGAPS